jgi:hypothetical protein
MSDNLPLQFVNLMALMAAWVYIFDTIQKEREALEMPERDVYAEAEAGQRPGQVSALCMDVAVILHGCCCHMSVRLPAGQEGRQPRISALISELNILPHALSSCQCCTYSGMVLSSYAACSDRHVPRSAGARAAARVQRRGRRSCSAAHAGGRRSADVRRRNRYSLCHCFRTVAGIAASGRVPNI